MEDSWPGRVEGLEVFDSSANRARQSGWRLKFPENFLTVPDIGRSHWSQIIRMLFTSTWKDARQIARLSICLITSHATADHAPGNGKMRKIRTKSVMKPDGGAPEQVRVKGRSDDKFKMIAASPIGLHSYLRASTGFDFAARIAGTKLAPTATIARNAATEKKTNGSTGLTP